MGGTVTPGWHSDPFGVHEARYFSADGQPTKLVRDRGAESYDEPPSGPDEVAAAMARMSAMPEPPSGYAHREPYPYDRAPERGPWRPSIGRFAVTWAIAAAAAVAIVLAAQVMLRAPKPASPQGALGTKDIGGVSCTGYAVTAPGTQGTITVWINPQHLVREIGVDTSLTISGDMPVAGASPSASPAGSTVTGSLDLTMDFTYSAAPVHVTAPPAATTMSYDAFLQQLGQNPALKQLEQSRG